MVRQDAFPGRLGHRRAESGDRRGPGPRVRRAAGGNDRRESHCDGGREIDRQPDRATPFRWARAGPAPPRGGLSSAPPAAAAPAPPRPGQAARVGSLDSGDRRQGDEGPSRVPFGARRSAPSAAIPSLRSSSLFLRTRSSPVSSSAVSCRPSRARRRGRTGRTRCFGFEDGHRRDEGPAQVGRASPGVLPRRLRPLPRRRRVRARFLCGGAQARGFAGVSRFLPSS